MKAWVWLNPNQDLSYDHPITLRFGDIMITYRLSSQLLWVSLSLLFVVGAQARVQKISINNTIKAATVEESEMCDVKGSDAGVLTAGQNAYVVNYNNNTVSNCPINLDGSFNTCDVYDAGGILDNPGNIAFHPSGSSAYVTNFGDWNGSTLVMCQVNADGSFREPCFISDGNGTFDEPNGLVVNRVGSYLYVANGGFSEPSSIAICPILCGGYLGVCRQQEPVGPLGSNGITLNPLNSLAYIVNYFSSFTDFTGDGSVTICSVNLDGSLSDCVEDTADDTVNGPIDIKINAANTIGYISNLGNNTISICSINSDGTFGTCTTSTGSDTVNGPGGIILNGDNSILYISNNNNNTVSNCPINDDGSLGTCTTIDDDSFNVPNDVFIF